MSEEEISISLLKNFGRRQRTKCYDTIDEYDVKATETVLNLVEKQQKEIEEKEIERKEEERFKLALFMIIRNYKVLPVGLQLGKNAKEINEMSVSTMIEILNMINYEEAKKLFEEGNKK